jgi:carbamoyltransferase
MGNELDLLVVGNCVMRKTEQDAKLRSDYRLTLEAD